MHFILQNYYDELDSVLKNLIPNPFRQGPPCVMNFLFGGLFPVFT